MGGGDDNDEVGCDDGAGDGVRDEGCIGTEECGANEDVVGLVEVSNVGYVEGYIRGESGGWDGGDDDGCIYGLMDGVDVEYGVGGGVGSSNGERVGNLVGMFIVDMDFFVWLVVGVGDYVGN